MKIVSMNCPHCGGTVKITDDQKSCICPFCDSALTIDDGKFHIVDEAKIKEIDFEQQKYQDEQQKEEKRKERREAWRKKCKQWVLIELASYFIASIIGFIYEAFSSKVFLYLAMPFASIYAIGMFVGPIYLAITRPDVDYEKNNPPFIKNKLLFCILLIFVGYILASVFGALLSIRF